MTKILERRLLQRPYQTTPEVFREQIIAQEALSQLVIPAVPGEYYSYSSIFTDGKPLYALMKCKSNKARVLGCAGQLGREVNLLFQFESASRAQVCGVKMAQTSGLLGDNVEGNLFGETWVALTKLAAEDFYELRSQKDSAKLVEVARIGCSEREAFAELEMGAVVAMMTDVGKYGLFLVKEITPTSVWIDACHVLL